MMCALACEHFTVLRLEAAQQAGYVLVPDLKGFTFILHHLYMKSGRSANCILELRRTSAESYLNTSWDESCSRTDPEGTSHCNRPIRLLELLHFEHL